MEDNVTKDDKTTGNPSPDKIVEGAIYALNLEMERVEIERIAPETADGKTKPARKPLSPIDRLSASELHG